MPASRVSPLFRDLPREHGFEPLRVDGVLPRELCGTLYRNGPVLFGSFGRRYDHAFEGDGGICAVRFGAGRAEGAHRLIRNPGLLEEIATRQPLFGSVVSRPRRIANALRGRAKNSANTNVLFWQGRLFGLVEVSRPMELDPDTLDTLGETDLDGSVAEVFSAHPHFVAARKAIYGFGTRLGRTASIDLFELPLGGRARRFGSVSLETPTIVHDFAATERHLVFFLGPARLRLGRALAGELRIDRLFSWEPARGTEIVVVPIDQPDRPARFRVDAFFQWHFANAFERGDEIVVDFVKHPDLSALGSLRDEAVQRGGLLDVLGGELWRATLDGRGSRLRAERLWSVPCEFPRVDSRGEGSPRGCIWLTTTDPELRAIARFDVERGEAASWRPPGGHHLSEAIFAPRPGSDDERQGWVLVLVFDERARTSHVAVLDAAAPEAGPVARVHFDHAIPFTLHGAWISA